MIDWYAPEVRRCFGAADPSQPTVQYPEISIPVFVKLLEARSLPDWKMLDAVVDIVNRSPFSVWDWAAKLDIEFYEFAQICHREKPATQDFRDRVRHYFWKFRGRRHVPWEECT